MKKEEIRDDTSDKGKSTAESGLKGLLRQLEKLGQQGILQGTVEVILFPELF